METKEKEEKNENGPLNLYKKTILWTKLSEVMQEMKDQHKITANLEKKIIAKFDEIPEELEKEIWNITIPIVYQIH